MVSAKNRNNTGLNTALFDNAEEFQTQLAKTSPMWWFQENMTAL
jgi:hypothetical protein